MSATSRMAEAERYYRRALEIDEACRGREHPEVATDLNALAELLKSKNEFAEAEAAQRRAISILEQSESESGCVHPNTTEYRENLGKILAAARAARRERL
jgi:tetratricopeptide (TPR) repeat protein